jgi:hypothetical protein
MVYIKKYSFLLLLVAFCKIAQAQTEVLQPLTQKITTGLSVKKTDLKGKTVRLDYFTLDDTEMGSVFSRALYQSLAKALPASGLPLRDNSNDLTKQQALAGKDDYAICGTYSEKGTSLVVRVALYDLKRKKSVLTLEETISTNVLTTQQLAWKPKQLEKAKQTRNLIVEDDEPAPKSTPSPTPNPAPAPEPTPTPEPAPARGDFALSVMTSKGFGHQIFTEGERMRIAVKAEKACFLRLVYHAADGQKVLLLENVPMTVSNEGNYITVPQDFECSAPFGVETLQLFACTSVFPPLKTHAQDGFIFIDEDIASVNTKTRGFKPVAGGNTDNSTVQRAEVSIQVTTLAK